MLRPPLKLLHIVELFDHGANKAKVFCPSKDYHITLEWVKKNSREYFYTITYLFELSYAVKRD